MKQLSLWLPIRSIAFLFVFAACAGILGKGFSEVGGWWSIAALILNVLTILLLVFLAKRNGLSCWQLINYHKGKTTWLQILGVTLLLFVVVMSGTYLAGFLCYRNFLYVPPVLLTPVPKVLAIINLVLLPVTTVLAEYGLYLGCGVNQIKNKYAAIFVPAFFYALQHCFIPTLHDGRYMVYRFIATLPFTLILCWYYYRKRNPLPVMIGYFLINLPAVIQMVATSFCWERIRERVII